MKIYRVEQPDGEFLEVVAADRLRKPARFSFEFEQAGR